MGEPRPLGCSDCQACGLWHCSDPLNCGGMRWSDDDMARSAATNDVSSTGIALPAQRKVAKAGPPARSHLAQDDGLWA